jgi:hypothetical protein
MGLGKQIFFSRPSLSLIMPGKLWQGITVSGIAGVGFCVNDGLQLVQQLLQIQIVLVRQFFQRIKQTLTANADAGSSIKAAKNLLRLPMLA